MGIWNGHGIAAQHETKTARSRQVHKTVTRMRNFGADQPARVVDRYEGFQAFGDVLLATEPRVIRMSARLGEVVKLSTELFVFFLLEGLKYFANSAWNFPYSLALCAGRSWPYEWIILLVPVAGWYLLPAARTVQLLGKTMRLDIFCQRCYL